MQIVEFRAELLPDLTRLVNEQIVSIPPCWSMSETQVALTIAQAGSLWGMHFPEDRDTYDSPTVCVLERREIVAAAQWLLPSQNRNACSICWIVGRPDYPIAVRTLLHLIENQATGGGYGKIEFARFSFGVGWFGIPVQWTHIIAGMRDASYEHTEKWIIMHGSTDAHNTLSPSPADDIKKLYWDMDKPALEWTLTAYDGEASIGECQVWGVPDQFEGCDGFEEWATVEWIEVNQAHQRRGLAKRLMAEQMRFHSRRGVKQFIAWSKQDNEAAHHLNQSMGFEDGPELAVLQKKLV
jgi:GNAT superfamily N-acetyltransferase